MGSDNVLGFNTSRSRKVSLERFHFGKDKKLREEIPRWQLEGGSRKWAS
jgi:hypothetical protein